MNLEAPPWIAEFTERGGLQKPQGEARAAPRRRTPFKTSTVPFRSAERVDESGSTYTGAVLPFPVGKNRQKALLLRPMVSAPGEKGAGGSEPGQELTDMLSTVDLTGGRGLARRAVSGLSCSTGAEGALRT